VVALGCFAGIVFFLYVFLMYIIPIRARFLKYGLSFLVGGMFGNVIDKIIFGKTVDFIPWNYFGIRAVFNMADVFLWIGAGIVFYILLGKDKLIWHPDSTRENFLIRPKEQYKVGLNFLLVVFCCSLVLGIFSYSFFNTTVAPYVVGKPHLMLTFFMTYSMITLEVLRTAWMCLSHWHSCKPARKWAAQHTGPGSRSAWVPRSPLYSLLMDTLEESATGSGQHQVQHTSNVTARTPRLVGPRAQPTHLSATR
jgi:hypothetical protein